MIILPIHLPFWIFKLHVIHHRSRHSRTDWMKMGRYGKLMLMNYKYTSTSTRLQIKNCIFCKLAVLIHKVIQSIADCPGTEDWNSSVAICSIRRLFCSRKMSPEMSCCILALQSFCKWPLFVYPKHAETFGFVYPFFPLIRTRGLFCTLQSGQ